MDNTDKAGKGIRYIDNRNKDCHEIGCGENNYECSVEFRHIDKNDKYSKEIGYIEKKSLYSKVFRFISTVL